MKAVNLRNVGDAFIGREDPIEFDICSACFSFAWFVCEEPKTFVWVMGGIYLLFVIFICIYLVQLF